MDEAEFAAAAERVLERIEASLEESGVDADVELKPGGVIEIEYADGSRMVINRHAAAREIWVAARDGGFHFRWDGSAWRDTREGTELFAALSKLVSAHSGQPVRLQPQAGGLGGWEGQGCRTGRGCPPLAGPRLRTSGGLTPP